MEQLKAFFALLGQRTQDAWRSLLRWAREIFTPSGRAARTRAAAERSRNRVSEDTKPVATQQPTGSRGFPRIFHPRKKPRNALLALAITTAKVALVVMLLAGASGMGAGFGLARAYANTTPALDLSKIEEQDETSFIYDGNGNLITTYLGLENRIWASIDEIPLPMQQAIIAIEDQRFYSHNGIDLKRIVGSLFSNLRTGSTQGGSTITQQIIKLRLLTSEQTYKRKLQEAFLAMELEKQYSKDQILEAYLNTVPLGGSNYGVKAAAKDYFGKELNELTLRECAMLAGLGQSPYYYNPRLNTYIRKNMDVTNRRTDTVLGCMYEMGFIDKTQYEQALKDSVRILEESSSNKMYDMPYFVEYAVYDVVTHMLKQRKLADNSTNRSAIENELRKGGYHIYTTVDPDIQLAMEDVIYNWKDYPALANSADEQATVRNADGTTQTINQPQAAAVLIDYRTGQIKGLVGGNYSPTAKRSLNRAYQSHMPVGSSIKPLSVYAPAIDLGAYPASITYNVPAKVEGWDSEQGFPSNYGGGGFTGPATLRTSLVRSLNVSAARILMEDVGVEESYNYLVSLGVTSGINKDGAGLALGTSGITTLEMSAAYGALGNKGMYLEPLSFTKVVDSHGNVILDAESIRIKRQVFKPGTAWLVVDMLEDAVDHGTGTRAQIDGFTVAGKTGTNSNNRGVFFSGLTGYYSCALWIGSDQYKPLISSATGGNTAAPLWQAIMARVHEGKEDTSIITESPEDLGLVRRTFCSVSGMLATDACAADPDHPTFTDWVPADAVLQPCNQHVLVDFCTQSGKIATEYCPQDTREVRSMVVLPTNSVMWQIEAPRTPLEYIGNLLFTRPLPYNAETFDATDPLYADYVCTIHTELWQQDQDAIAQQKANSQALITTVQQQIDDPPEELTSQQLSSLNSAIQSLQNQINNPDATMDALVSAHNNLLNVANQVFS